MEKSIFVPLMVWGSYREESILHCNGLYLLQQGSFNNFILKPHASKHKLKSIKNKQFRFMTNK